MNVSWVRAASACVACWALSLPAAQAESLTLRAAVALVVEGNPELAAFAEYSNAAREQAGVQSLAPNPVIELQLENFAGSGDLSGVSALETTLQLSRVVELGGKARLRQQLGEVQLHRLTAEQHARRTDVLAEVARRFVLVLANQERLAARQRAVVLAEEAAHAVRSRVDAGVASPVQSSRAAIALARANIAREHAEHELLGSRVALAVLWNEETPQFSAVSGALLRLDAHESFDTYRKRLDGNPDLLTFASTHRVLDARVQLEEAQRRPSVTFNVGVRRIEFVDAGALVAGVAVPFGTRGRVDGELRSVRAERAALTLTEQSRRLELHSTLFSLYQELSHARTEADVLREGILPQARHMLETTRTGYQAGRFSFPELADAQGQLLEIELEAIDAAARFHLQLIEIERLTGQSVGRHVQEVSP
ncbi:TolC family protein [Povalibacter sp.]|uniref:TolC family protein n=1 Tax=Povalibacter sp. TaxID=1962978 RepID=UPI002F3F8620